MLVTFLGLTLFVSAFLLFWCQPMVAKMVLPLLGGAASVWTTCVLFFQVMLLGGYVYAHWVGQLKRVRNQLLIHGSVLLSVLFFLPIRFTGDPGRAAADHPVTWLLTHLTLAAGIPFFAVSTSAPLLQNWLSRTSVDSRRDPYFLYAASNAGSLLSLIAYPLLIEPRLGLIAQSRLWWMGYAILLAMIAIVALAVHRHSQAEPLVPETTAVGPPPALRTRMLWLSAAFVPSALMLAVTNHISMNLASIPFLWVIPLAVYLVTFIMAFARSYRVSAARLSQWSPFAFILMLLIVPDIAPVGATLNWLMMAAHIGVLFFSALFCHTVLADNRPDARYLTAFYFWIALGGALGGIFTGLIAPAVFKTIFEYPLLVAMLPFVRIWGSDSESRTGVREWFYPAVIAALFTANWYATQVSRIHINIYLSILPDVAFFIALLAFRKRKLRFALSFAVLLFGYALTASSYIEGSQRIYVARDFFGVKKVLFDPVEKVRKLINGDIIHGLESTEPGRSGIPLSYYHTTGPFGDVMALIQDRPDQSIGVVGLGTGSVAGYGQAGRHITFFDIDPQVESIARNYFTFLNRCGDGCNVVIGDGRLSLEKTPDRTFDLLLLDAFSSDSIPAHLISREALRIYQAKLKPDGLLLFHVSNRYLNVAGLVAAVTTDAGLVVYMRSDRDQSIPGKSGSDYAVAARYLEDLGRIPLKGSWQRVPPNTGIKPWTDDYSNMLSLLRWGQ